MANTNDYNNTDNNIFNYVASKQKDNRAVPNLTERETKKIKELNSEESVADLLNQANDRSQKENRPELIPAAQDSVNSSQMDNNDIFSFSSIFAQPTEADRIVADINNTQIPVPENPEPTPNDTTGINSQDFINPIDTAAESLPPLKGRYEKEAGPVPAPEAKVSTEQTKNFNISGVKVIASAKPGDNDKAKDILTNSLPSSANQNPDFSVANLNTANNLHSDITAVQASRDIQIPVDLYFENNVQTPSFNLEKTFRWYGMDKLADIFQDQDMTRFQTPFFDKIAAKQYQKYLKRIEMSTAERQKSARKSLFLRILIPIVIIILMILAIVPRITKTRVMNSGFEAIASEKYEIAEQIMCEQAKHGAYCVYARALRQMSDHEYDEAYQNLEKIRNYQSSIKYNIDDTVNEVKYQQAKYLIEGKQYAEGLRILREISNYKDAADVFFSTCYDLAQTYESSDSEVALKYYYMAKDYEDAPDRYKAVGQKMYDEAIEHYENQDFDLAQEIFTTLSKYNFSDAKMMYNQCIYKKALIAYQAGDYETSNSLFKTIKNFKDSSALIYDPNAPSNLEVSYMVCAPSDAEDPSFADTETEFGRIACRFSPESFEGTIVEVLPATEENPEGTEVTSTYMTLEDFNKALEEIAIKYDAPFRFEYGLETSDDSKTEDPATTDSVVSGEELFDEENPSATPETSATEQTASAPAENADETKTEENPAG